MTPIATLDGVTKRYGGVVALNEVSLALSSGVTELLGPNGAGKTTAVKLLLGLARPTTGQVTVGGGDPRQAATRAHTGAMMQVGKVPETLRVREHIDLFRHYYPNPLSIDEALSIAGLTELANRRFGALSGGE